MKIKRLFKINLAVSFTALYLTGFLYWWLVSRHPQTPETEPVAGGTLFLHSHSILGLWSLILFGYLYRSHIQPGFKAKRRRLSGFATLTALVILIVTVPGLFYLVNEEQKTAVAALHTYLGLAILFPVALHSLRWSTPPPAPTDRRDTVRRFRLLGFYSTQSLDK